MGKKDFKILGLVVLIMAFTFTMAACDMGSSPVDEVKEADAIQESYVTALGNNGDVNQFILYAGQDIEVGIVTVTNDDNYLDVKYEITEDGWGIYETHVHVGIDLEDFPLAGRWGNPVPGQFDYKEEHDGVTEYTRRISLDDFEVEDELIIAAHAVVKKIDCLPEVVNFNIRDWANPNTFRIVVEDIGYDGLGWCADAGTRIESGASIFFNGYVYASTSLPDDAPECVATWPWGGINWILNNWETLGYSSGDAQIAMWSLIHDYDFGEYGNTNFYGLTWNQDNVDELLSSVDPDFEPGPDDLVAVVLLVDNICPDYDPEDVPPFVKDRGAAKQMVFIGLPRKDTECEIEEETAWADGSRFTEQGNWATYFEYTVQ